MMFLSLPNCALKPPDSWRRRAEGEEHSSTLLPVLQRVQVLFDLSRVLGMSRI